ncbi:MAG: thioredoxin family protein [Herminiimonas sp.]|jgi:thioredoxin 1|nr:thioredoxin family protein [Herminiimonas sp.]
MTSVTLELDNRTRLLETLTGDAWMVACLCAAWCDVCRQYRAGFDAFAARHPDKHFVWIDIEDQADVVGDLDVENFPCLLIQRGDTVAFFGTVLPDWRQANRLLEAQVEKSEVELKAEATGSKERMTWQENCNLRDRIRQAL